MPFLSKPQQNFCKREFTLKLTWKEKGSLITKSLFFFKGRVGGIIGSITLPDTQLPAQLR